MKTPLQRLLPATAIAMVVMFALASSSSAQLPIPLPTSTSTPTPDPTPEPTKTSSPTPKPTRSTDDDGGDDNDGGGTTTKKRTTRRTTTTKQQDPAVAKGIASWLGRIRTPPRTTTRLLELIERSDDGTPVSKRQAFGHFPVVGYVWYQDDYGAPRYIPYFHKHEGTDLFAKSGTPVIAVVDGTIVKLSQGGTGGNAVWLMGNDGVRYYYGHLRSVARGIAVGDRVRQGDVVGRVGATGDSAKGTYPHVHFEVNPGGRGTINAKPVLDAWLTAAEAALLDRLGLLRAQDALAPFGAARWGLLSEMFADGAGAPPALWGLALDGSGATMAYAELMMRDMLTEMDLHEVGPAGATGSSTHPRFERDTSWAALFGHAE